MAKAQVSFEFFLLSFVCLILVTILSYAVIWQKNSIVSSSHVSQLSYSSEADARAIENSLYSGFQMNYSFDDNLDKTRDIDYTKCDNV